MYKRQDESHDLEHRKAGCIYQHQFFKDIISSIGNVTKIKVFNTYEENIKNFHYDDFDVFLWTGGLGNIYLSNQHNKDLYYVGLKDKYFLTPLSIKKHRSHRNENFLCSLHKY